MRSEHQTSSMTGQRRAPRLFTNPVIRRLYRVDSVARDGASATYAGIGFKTFYFLLLTVIGAVFAFQWIPMQLGSGGSMSSPLAVSMLVAVAVALITPITCWLIRPLIPVTGSLYCLAQGFLIPFGIIKFGAKYSEMITIAFGLTILIIFVMYLLYSRRIIRVNHKFRAVVATLFFSSIGATLLFGFMRVIPATAHMASFIQNDPLTSIILGVVMIVIAALFLLNDFDAIEYTVENRLEKKYEWMASFGLAFSVIWLYLKVLSLLSKESGKSK